MRQIIDAHCHIYPAPIARRAIEAVIRFYDGIPQNRYDGTADELVSSGRAAGISRFVVHSVATAPSQVDAINGFIAQSVADSNGAFTGLGTLHPDAANLERDFKVLRMLGLKGVKLHPDIQRFDADDPRAMRIYALCADAGLPVCLHAGDSRFDRSNPPRIANVLKAFPKLKLIGAHFGGWGVWEEAKALADYPNIVVDTSSSFYALKPHEARALIDAWGPERVMFGTDYPLWNQQTEIDCLLSLGLSDLDLERIFWKNCAALFDIQ